MPVNITDVDAFTDPITAPAGADAANAASVVQIAQKLANRTRYLFNRIENGYFLKSIVVYTASDTWTKAADVRAVRVIVVGGGGGGGAGSAGADDASGSGGGGGGVASKFITAPGASETVTVGAGGTGGIAGGAAPAAGGDSVFGAHCTGGGGSAGLTMSATTGTSQAGGGNGGAATGGDFNVDGSPGFSGIVTGGVALAVNCGGGNIMAPHTEAATAGNGNNGKAYGAGGSGGHSAGAGGNGGDGAPGVVIVEEYV